MQNLKKKAIKYICNAGPFSVQYECDYFDLKQKINKREASGTGNPYLDMRKQNLDKNTVKYYCKSPNKDSFDALVFTIHWEVQLTKYL